MKGAVWVYCKHSRSFSGNFDFVLEIVVVYSFEIVAVAVVIVTVAAVAVVVIEIDESSFLFRLVVANSSQNLAEYWSLDYWRETDEEMPYLVGYCYYHSFLDTDCYWEAAAVRPC